MATALPDDLQDHTVCIVGLGFVGLTLAAAMAEVGFNVVGIEIREEVLAAIRNKRAHFHEPGLTAHLVRAIDNKRLEVHARIPADCKATVFIVTVGTPLDAEGRVSMAGVRNCAEEIASRLKDGDLVILRSTVQIGTTRKIVGPILAATGRRHAVAFCPERTVEGQALRELRVLPQIIGALDARTATRASLLFGQLTPTVVRVSDPETAEMIKLIDNTKRDVMFGFANEVARLCDAIGISAAEVIRSGRFGYSRTDLPMPGPVGGPCLSKDSHILGASMVPYGVTPEITLAARRVNERQADEVSAFLARLGSTTLKLPKAPRIAVLGVAFKGQPETDDVRGTTALGLQSGLLKQFPGAALVGYDPIVDAKSLAAIGFAPAATLEEAFEGAHLAIVHNNHPAFSRMPIERLAARMARPAAIYDCWNNFIDQPLALPGGVSYIALGSQLRPITGLSAGRRA
jgi:nucleotide sugar dehydrogenase